MPPKRCLSRSPSPCASSRGGYSDTNKATRTETSVHFSACEPQTFTLEEAAPQAAPQADLERPLAVTFSVEFIERTTADRESGVMPEPLCLSFVLPINLRDFADNIVAANEALCRDPWYGDAMDKAKFKTEVAALHARLSDLAVSAMPKDGIENLKRHLPLVDKKSAGGWRTSVLQYAPGSGTGVPSSPIANCWVSIDTKTPSVKEVKHGEPESPIVFALLVEEMGAMLEDERSDFYLDAPTLLFQDLKNLCLFMNTRSGLSPSYGFVAKSDVVLHLILDHNEHRGSS